MVPFFEQLYRQTITGSRDVLGVLADEAGAKVRILPFDAQADAEQEAAVVTEGFPGWILRQRGFRATGYKRSDEGGPLEARGRG